MAEGYKSMEEVLKDGFNIIHVIEWCMEENSSDVFDPLEDDYKKLCNDLKLTEKINKEIIESITKILKKYDIDLGYSYIEIDADEIYKFLYENDYKMITKENLYSMYMYYIDKEDIEKYIKTLEDKGKIKIEDNKIIIR